MGIVSIAFSALAALGLIASFPPYDHYFMAWISLVPLFAVLRNQSGLKSFALVFFSMFIFFLATLRWLSVFGPAAWILSAAFQSLFPAAWGTAVCPFFKGPRISFWRILFPPVSFTAMEAFRNLGNYGMPWGDLAYTQWRFLPFVQAASLTGALGLSFILVLVNVLVYYSILQKKLKFLFAGGLCLLVPFLGGKIRLRLRQTFPETLKVALVQTNDLQSLKWSSDHYRRMLEELNGLAGQVKPREADLVVFPETALAGYLASDISLQRLVDSWAKKLSAYLAVGTLAQKNGKPQNAVALIAPGGFWTQTYAKIKLVPFGEYLPSPLRPFKKAWYLLDSIVDFAPGTQHTVFDIPGKARFGVMICFESSFGWMARELALSGAQFLAVSTNDAWFSGTPAQEMHAVMAVFRAVETGRSCVQAGNTGISLIADPLGRILARQKPDESAVVAGAVPLSSELTVYDRMGDVFGYVCLGITVAGFIAGLAPAARWVLK